MLFRRVANPLTPLLLWDQTGGGGHPSRLVRPRRWGQRITSLIRGRHQWTTAAAATGAACAGGAVLTAASSRRTRRLAAGAARSASAWTRNSALRSSARCAKKAATSGDAAHASPGGPEPLLAS